MAIVPTFTAKETAEPYLPPSNSGAASVARDGRFDQFVEVVVVIAATYLASMRCYDEHWTGRSYRGNNPSTMNTRILIVGVIAGITFLNSLLTLQNIWPTPWVQPVLEISLEFAALTLILALWVEFRGPVGKPMRRLILAVVLLLIAGRYGDITAPAMFGRRIDLYWDLRHVPSVAAMFVEAAPWWRIVGLAAGVAALIAAIFLAVRLAVAALLTGFAIPALRRGAGLLAAAAILLHAIGLSGVSTGAERWFALPVAPVYARQAAFLVRAAEANTLQSTPMAESDLAAIDGADTFAIFLESYGAVVFESPRLYAALAAEFARFDAFLDQSAWRAASAFVDSPTYGGASWLAHATLLSGRWIAHESDYRMFLAAPAETLADRFRAAGYRTVGLFPGIKLDWPEGAALGFDRILDARRLAYRGPAFGWWTIPDQYSLERLNQGEIMRPDRKPLFVAFASIMSHWPFGPTPPYEPDWSRVTSTTPFQPGALAQALAIDPLDDPGAAYLRTVRHNLRLVRGFLAERAPAESLVLVAGDHQPPAMVGGKAESWSVPVHLFTRDAAIAERFLQAGFKPGLRPNRPTLTRMDGLNRLLLKVLDSKFAVTR